MLTDKPIQYHYKADTLLRYNPLWALVSGQRSVGKSFEFKRRSITTPDSIWVYLRRTDKLRKDPKNWKSYLSDLLQAEVIDPDAEYKVNSEGLWVDGVQKVIFSALSTDSGAHSMNYLPDSTGMKEKVQEETPDSNTDLRESEAERIEEAIGEVTAETKSPTIRKKIVFEEMLEPTGNYLKNEVEQLFEFYVTVDRYTDTQLFGLANLMTTYNPYFEYFGITPFTQEFKWFKNKTLLVQNVKLEGSEEFVKSQRFYNLVEGTDYGEYLTNNTPWQDDAYGIEKKPPKAVLRYNLRMYGELFGIWEYDGTIYVSRKNNPEYTTFSGIRSKKDYDIPIQKGQGVHRLLDTASGLGALRFENASVREMTYQIINGGFKDA